jgi:hypothetical protein
LEIYGGKMKEKMYYADVRIEFGMSFDAKNKKEAIEFLKDNFKDDYGIDLREDEIIKLEEVK